MGLFRKKSTAVEHQTEPSAPPPAGDPSLPGTAGYRRRQTGDAMPHRFGFVRPDGRPEPQTKKSWWRAP